MRGFVRRAGLVLVVLLAFVLQQTGAARICDPCTDHAADDCADACEDEGALGCPPSCADCSGCPGPARGLVAQTWSVQGVPSVGTLPASWVAAPAGVDPHPRLDRPPRS